MGGCECKAVTTDYKHGGQWLGCGKNGWCEVVDGCSSARKASGRKGPAGWDFCTQQTTWDTQSDHHDGSPAKFFSRTLSAVATFTFGAFFAHQLQSRSMSVILLMFCGRTTCTVGAWRSRGSQYRELLGTMLGSAQDSLLGSLGARDIRARDIRQELSLCIVDVRDVMARILNRNPQRQI